MTLNKLLPWIFTIGCLSLGFFLGASYMKQTDECVLTQDSLRQATLYGMQYQSDNFHKIIFSSKQETK